MGLTKQQIIDKQRQEDIVQLHVLLEVHYPHFTDLDEALQDLGYDQCASCEEFWISASDKLLECQVCSELFCEDCRDEHNSDETGF